MFCTIRIHNYPHLLRHQAFAAAQKYIKFEIVKPILQTTLSNIQHEARNFHLAPKNAIYVHCEKNKCWTRPRSFSSVYEKAVYLDVVEGNGACQYIHS